MRSTCAKAMLWSVAVDDNGNRSTTHKMSTSAYVISGPKHPNAYDAADICIYCIIYQYAVLVRGARTAIAQKIQSISTMDTTTNNFTLDPDENFHRRRRVDVHG